MKKRRTFWRKRILKRFFILTALVALVISGVYAGAGFLSRNGVRLPVQEGPRPGEVSVSSEASKGESLPDVSAPEPVEAPEPSAEDPRIPSEPVESYARWLARQIAEELITPGMSEYEKAKAGYDYLVQNVSKGEAVCPELWRIYQKDPNTPVPFVENRAVGTLRFDIGMCEDQAAALTLLLQEMGLEAEYIPGFIFTIQGDAMDHAWMMAKVDGNWYHLDPDLESYRARRGRIIYQYFLKGDNDFYRTHRWGQNAIDAGYLGEEQNEELRQYLGHPCPEDYDPAAGPQRLNGRAEPEASKAMLLAEKAQKRAEEEIAAYEAEHGALAPIQLNMEPPVFGWEGYGPEIW